MTEMHLRQPAALANLRFTYSGCRPFTKNRKNSRIQRKRKFTIYLSKRTRLNLLST